MNQTNRDQPSRLAFFTNAGQADQAVRRLLAAGFKQEQLAIICPQNCCDQLPKGVQEAARPGDDAARAIIKGGVVGAAVGGVALAATVIATGGAAVPAIPVLLGGGALAGGISSLILTDGYGKEIGQNYEEAIRQGKTVVGVEARTVADEEKLELAERILHDAGGSPH